MQTFTIGELKARFSEVVNRLREGQEIVISYGKKREKVGVLVPYSNYNGKPERNIGVLEHKARVVIHDDFKVKDEDLLLS